LDSPAVVGTVTLRAPRNWTIILFLAGLGALHFVMATMAFAHGQWAGFLSFAFGIIFLLAAAVAWMIRSDVNVIAAERAVLLRTGIRGFGYQRVVPFSQIRLVRLMMPPAASDPISATIEIVCHREVIECPPTRIPRQEALCLAMLMKVRLVKVFGDDASQDATRVDSLMT
jgi:hypothetical protein